MKQNLRSLAALFLAAALLLALAACSSDPSGASNTPNGTSSSNPGQSNSPSNDSNKTDLTPYEFLGEYHDLAAEFGMDFYFLGKMNSDGTGVIYMAQGGRRDGNTSVTYEETPVTWSQETDRDGLVMFKAKSGSTGNDFGSVDIYQESDGSFQWEYTFQFSGGYSRTISFIGSDTITYATTDEWKSFAESNMFSTVPSDNGGGNDGETDGDSKEVSFSFYGEEVKQADGTVCSNMGAQINLYSDGTASAVRGYAAGGSVAYAYSTDEGTWTQEGDALAIVIADKTYTAENGGDGYTFTWETSSEEEGTLTVNMTAH